MCGVIGIVLNTAGPRAAFRNGLLVALAGAVLVGCGGPGVCFLPAIALWLAYAGVVILHSDGPRNYLCGGTLLAAAAGGLLLVAHLLFGQSADRGSARGADRGLGATRLFATVRRHVAGAEHLGRPAGARSLADFGLRRGGGGNRRLFSAGKRLAARAE